MTRPGEFNWIELQTRHTKSAIEFYQAAAGWKFKPETMPTGGTYWIAYAAQKPVCGLWTLDDSSDLADRWLVFLHVEDLQRAISIASGLGGKVTREPWFVPGIGNIAMIQDPGGAETGLVTPT